MRMEFVLHRALYLAARNEDLLQINWSKFVDTAAAQVIVNWRDLLPFGGFRLASLSGYRNKLNFDYSIR